jgi:bifunctional UDP-N-acetylglucosamine pyrophosphorylase/glucosamine-1-phosphate N-acetyltransferase
MKTRLPKMLHEALGRSLVERMFEITQTSGLETPTFVVGKNAGGLEAALSGRSVQFAVQDQPRGTGDAVAHGFKKLSDQAADQDSVLILNGDSVLIRPQTIRSLLQLHQEASAVMSFLTTELESPRSYGRVVRDSTGVVEKIVEAKNASDAELSIHEINAGFYLVRVGALRDFLEQIKPDSVTGELYFTEVVGFLRNRNALVRAHCTEDSSEVMGINTQGELCLTEEVLRMRVMQKHLDAGVRLMSLDSLWIEEGVEIEADVALEPGVILKGNSVLKKGCQVGAYSIIENSEIGPDSRVEAHSVVQDSQVGPNCKVGPFARLRPGTNLVSDVKIGNFVEVKNSEFKQASKANHLSYVGDTTVGKSANIGAGTITCNYDGVKKHQTEIGDDVFIGSNSSLVAPLKIGKSAIVGAGSVITLDVPADSLAVERSEQKNKDAGATEFRNKRSK